MKRVLSIVVLVLAVGVSSLVLGQATGQDEVRDAHNKRLQALVHGDISALDQLVGEDVIYTSPTGRVQKKADIVSDLRSGALKVESIESDDVELRVYGDTAVVTYGSTTKFQDRG